MSCRERQTYQMAARDFSGPAVEEQPTAAEAKILFCQCLFISQPMFNFAPESLGCKLSFPIHAGHRWTERANVSVSRPRIDSSKSCRRRGEKWHRQHRSGCPINLALHRYLVRVKKGWVAQWKCGCHCATKTGRGIVFLAHYPRKRWKKWNNDGNYTAKETERCWWRRQRESALVFRVSRLNLVSCICFLLLTVARLLAEAVLLTASLRHQRHDGEHLEGLFFVIYDSTSRVLGFWTCEN